MKDIENPDGSKSDKVKLIRSESIGEYSWDNKASGTGSSTSDNGSNDWSDSVLQKVLNEGAYYNRTSGDCPVFNGVVVCDFSNTGLTEESKNMINVSVWNLGGGDSNEKKVSQFYTLERGEEVYEGRLTKWTGHVGLIYPSDYGYATSGGSTTDRATCLNINLRSWDGSNLSDCKNNDWLFNSYKWTLMPDSSSSSNVFYLATVGSVGYTTVRNRNEIHPSVYLNTSVGIENEGEGSSTSPFVLR